MSFVWFGPPWVVLVVIVTIVIYWRFFKRKVGWSDARIAHLLDHPSDDVVFGGELTGANSFLSHIGGQPDEAMEVLARDQTKFRRWALAELKAKLGTPELTQANRLMVLKEVRRLLQEHGVRPSHISQHAPVLAALVFVPSRADIEAAGVFGKAASARIKAAEWVTK